MAERIINASLNEQQFETLQFALAGQIFHYQHKLSEVHTQEAKDAIRYQLEIARSTMRKLLGGDCC